MLQARQVNDRIAVASQIHLADMADIAAAGYKSIICNRPDNEEAGQPAYAEIEAEAQKHGLQMRWLAVVSGALENEQGHEFGALLADLPAPVLAYCRSGTRSIMLWALSEAGKRPAVDIIRDAAAAGYDIAGLAPRLEAIAAAGQS